MITRADEESGDEISEEVKEEMDSAVVEDDGESSKVGADDDTDGAED